MTGLELRLPSVSLSLNANNTTPQSTPGVTPTHAVSPSNLESQIEVAGSGSVVVPVILELDDGAIHSGEAVYNAAGELMESAVIHGTGGQVILAVTNSWIFDGNWVVDHQSQQHYSESGELLLEADIRRDEGHRPASAGPGEVGVLNSGGDCSDEANASFFAGMAFAGALAGTGLSVASAIASGGAAIPVVIKGGAYTGVTYAAWRYSTSVLDNCLNGGSGGDDDDRDIEMT